MRQLQLRERRAWLHQKGVEVGGGRRVEGEE